MNKFTHRFFYRPYFCARRWYSRLINAFDFRWLNFQGAQSRRIEIGVGESIAIVHTIMCIYPMKYLFPNYLSR